MNADRVIDFINNSTNHELAFLLTILAQRILVWDGDKLIDVEGCSMNGTCFQLNPEQTDPR